MITALAITHIREKLETFVQICTSTLAITLLDIAFGTWRQRSAAQGKA
ncbi:hypothetical protein [Nostoc sp. DSM 114167]|jgi:hypothetical protein